eukprot:2131492-Pyramimonas_sp.AAC.1
MSRASRTTSFGFAQLKTPPRGRHSNTSARRRHSQPGLPPPLLLRHNFLGPWPHPPGLSRPGQLSDVV